MRPSVRQRGMSLIETAIASMLGIAVVLVAGRILMATSDVAGSTTAASSAELRADHVVWSLAEDLRRASLARVQHLDTNPFADGDSATGISLQVVERWIDGVPEGPRRDYQLLGAIAGGEGRVIRRSGGQTTVVARGVTRFRLTRQGRRFLISLTAVAGPNDDRRRTVTHEVSASPRNP
jgi:hypothetical protein